MPFVGGTKLGKEIGKLINYIKFAKQQFFIILIKNYIFENIIIEGKIYE